MKNMASLRALSQEELIAMAKASGALPADAGGSQPLAEGPQA
jgi:hypothetical protein